MFDFKKHDFTHEDLRVIKILHSAFKKWIKFWDVTTHKVYLIQNHDLRQKQHTNGQCNHAHTI